MRQNDGFRTLLIFLGALVAVTAIDYAIDVRYTPSTLGAHGLLFDLIVSSATFLVLFVVASCAVLLPVLLVRANRGLSVASLLSKVTLWCFVIALVLSLGHWYGASHSFVR
jgi:hypothetical protein